MLFDVSGYEQIASENGGPRWQRTLNGTLANMVRARQTVRRTPNVFLASSGEEIKKAFKSGRTAVFLQIQGGGEIVGEDLARIDLMHELGLRVLQITHHTNNKLGGGGLEPKLSGLTPLGFTAVERMNALGIIPDLSHASDLTAYDVLKASRRPVILSHGAARAIVNNARCTPDEVIRGIAASGGVMGIFMMSFWLTNDAVPSVDDVVKHVRHVIKVGGIEAVGIANDFPLAGEQSLIAAGNDNAVAVKNYHPWWDSMAKSGILGFDRKPQHVAVPELNNINRFQILHSALKKSGFKATELEKILGGNWIRVLS